MRKNHKIAASAPPMTPRAMQLLRMVDEQVHQMVADHTSNDGPWSKIAHRLCVQSSPRSLANQQPGRDRHACRREHTKRLQRNGPDVQRRELAVWEPYNPGLGTQCPARAMRPQP